MVFTKTFHEQSRFCSVLMTMSWKGVICIKILKCSSEQWLREINFIIKRFYSFWGPHNAHHHLMFLNFFLLFCFVCVIFCPICDHIFSSYQIPKLESVKLFWTFQWSLKWRWSWQRLRSTKWMYIFLPKVGQPVKVMMWAD